MTEVEPSGVRVVSSAQAKEQTLNVNRYATKKTIAQGMLDIALLTANASQLKYVLQAGKTRHPFYTLMLSLISVSIVLQVISGMLALSMNMLRDCRLHLVDNNASAVLINYLQLVLSTGIAMVNLVISAFDPAYSVGLLLTISVGVCFLIIGSLNINKPKSQRTADLLNNAITFQIFIITTVNIIISSFGIEHVVLEEQKHYDDEARRLSGIKAAGLTGGNISFERIASASPGSGRVIFNENGI